MEFLDLGATAELGDCAELRCATCETESTNAVAALALAQRAFAAYVDASTRRIDVADATFGDPRLLDAQRTLSALSADDRQQLQRWLGLQWVTDPRGAVAACVWRVDRSLARAVEATLAATRGALFAPRKLAA